MNHAQAGRRQLEHAILHFPGLLSEEIDLAAFMDEEQVHKIRRAGHYRDKLIELMSGNGEAGYPTPWAATRGKFEFRPSELTVWSGAKGHGKSLVVSQVLEKFLREGQKIFIISPEFPPHRVLHRMLVQSVGTEATVTQALAWLDDVTQRLWLYDQQKSLSPEDVPALCRFATDCLGVDHVLIDSLMKCGISPDDYNAQKRLTDAIQQVAHRSRVHVHLVAHGRKGSGDERMGGLHDVKGTPEIADMAENVLIVWRNKAKEMGAGAMCAPDCIVKVEAQRNGHGWIGRIPLYFDRNSSTFHDHGA